MESRVTFSCSAYYSIGFRAASCDAKAIQDRAGCCTTSGKNGVGITSIGCDLEGRRQSDVPSNYYHEIRSFPSCYNSTVAVVCTYHAFFATVGHGKATPVCACSSLARTKPLLNHAMQSARTSARHAQLFCISKCVNEHLSFESARYL